MKILVIFKSKMKGKLYLMPNTLGECPINNVIPSGVLSILHSLDHFIVENIRTARRLLIKSGHPKKTELIKFYVLNKYTDQEDIDTYLDPCEHGLDIGVISEAGVPVIADPGSVIVRDAHKKGIQVIPMTGPSSFLLALMASGFNGQNFTFLGYLPINRERLIQKIKDTK